MALSNIEWTDFTFNPWRGCSKVSTGCEHCYAESNRAVVAHGTKWGTEKQGGTRTVAAEGTWKEPLKWNREEKWNERPRAFCASLGDVFEDWDGPMVDHQGQRLNVCNGCGIWPGINCDCPSGDKGHIRPLTMCDVRARLFRMIDLTPNLDWLLLTKRPENIRRGIPPVGDERKSHLTIAEFDALMFHRPNVWLGTSVENQEQADKRIPALLKCRDLSPVTFLSAEPLLGPVDLEAVVNEHPPISDAFGYRIPQPVQSIDWVIAGGESGPKARHCNLKWIESLRDQCVAAGVPFFCKQLGSKPMALQHPFGPCALDLKDKKGGDWDEWPEDLRVREMPK